MWANAFPAASPLHRRVFSQNTLSGTIPAGKLSAAAPGTRLPVVMLKDPLSRRLSQWVVLLCVACGDSSNAADTTNGADVPESMRPAEGPAQTATASSVGAEAPGGVAMPGSVEDDGHSAGADNFEGPEDASDAPSASADMSSMDGPFNSVQDGGTAWQDAGDSGTDPNAEASNPDDPLLPPPMTTIPLQPLGDGNCGGVHCSFNCCPAPLYCQMSPCPQ
jgi:hypothetical protein